MRGYATRRFGPNELILIGMILLLYFLPVIGVVVAILFGAKLVRRRKEPESIKVADEIRKLAELRDQSIITEEEFNEQKRKLLER